MDLTDKRVMSKINQKKALVFIITRKLKEKKLKGRIKKFSGYQTIGLFKISDLQNFHINLDIKEGQACLVAIQKKDMKVITEKSVDCHTTLPFTKGYVRFRLIGKQASLNLEITKI
jgi:L-ribulose-5-phosphate 3-epimerase UlaE